MTKANKLEPITVANRIEAWKTQLDLMRQQLIDMSRDIDSFKNFCLDVEKAENEAENEAPVLNCP